MWNELKDSIKYNRDRLFLTGLGICIGNIAVVIIIILSYSFSSNLVTKYTNQATIGLVISSESSMTLEEILVDTNLQSAISDIKYVEGVKEWCVFEGEKNVQIATDLTHKAQNVEIDFYNASVIDGKSFSEFSGNGVIARINEEFENRYQIGQEIYVNNIGYEIIGFTDELSEGLGYPTFYFPEQMEDKIEYIQNTTEGTYLLTIHEGYQLNEIRNIVLKQLNACLLESEAEFIDYSSETEKALEETVTMATTFLVFIAAISLVVAAINVVNIMYITALEKTHEIAIYRALGMRKSMVMYQFLLQSSAVVIFFSFIGYIIGLLLSAMLLVILDVSIIVPWWSVLVIMALSICVGVIAGLKPALKAANVSPAILLK